MSQVVALLDCQIVRARRMDGAFLSIHGQRRKSQKTLHAVPWHQHVLAQHALQHLHSLRQRFLALAVLCQRHPVFIELIGISITAYVNYRKDCCATMQIRVDFLGSCLFRFLVGAVDVDDQMSLGYRGLHHGGILGFIAFDPRYIK